MAAIIPVDSRPHRGTVARYRKLGPAVLYNKVVMAEYNISDDAKPPRPIDVCSALVQIEDIDFSPMATAVFRSLLLLPQYLNLFTDKLQATAIMDSIARCGTGQFLYALTEDTSHDIKNIYSSNKNFVHEVLKHPGDSKDSLADRYGVRRGAWRRSSYDISVDAGFEPVRLVKSDDPTKKWWHNSGKRTRAASFAAPTKLPMPGLVGADLDHVVVFVDRLNADQLRDVALLLKELARSHEAANPLAAELNMVRKMQDW